MRAFIAIDLPEPVRSALRREQTAFRSICPDARWTRPEGIHLTLKFLGEITEAQVREVAEALAKLDRFETFSVEVKGFGFFPDARRPRVLWAGVEALPGLNQLAQKVEDAMEKLGFARENRPFRPHLTLARFGNPRAQPKLEDGLEEMRETLLGCFEVSEFFLFESKLSGAGAPTEYRKVARFPA